MSTEKNEILLLKASLQGDTTAFERIVSKYQGYICAVTYSAVGDVEKSEELAHETFISAWTSLAQLKDLAKFRGWLGTIARNVVRNSFRDKKRDIISAAASIDSVGEPTSAADESDEQALTEQRQAIAEQALKRIPEKYREVIVLYYRQDQSIKEVAAQLELSEDAVKQRLSRGRKMLKEQAAEMIETTISRTGPSKAFTACVMASVGTLVLKGAAAAGTVAVAAAGGKAGTLSAMFSTVTAKIVTAAAVAVIAVGGAVMYKNMKSPPVVEENKVVVADSSQDSGVDDAVGNSNDDNAASLQPGMTAIEPNETVSGGPATVVRYKDQEVEEAPQYVDPNSISDIYCKNTRYKADGSLDTGFLFEYWIKKPDQWRVNRRHARAIINNGIDRLQIEHRGKTAQFSDSRNSKGVVGKIPYTKLLTEITRMGSNLITGKDIRHANTFYTEKDLIEKPRFVEKTSDGLMLYSYRVLRPRSIPEDTFMYIDSKTGLVKKMWLVCDRASIEFLFDYSEIGAEVFSLGIPSGYKELARRLPPKFHGWIFDENLKPVANAEVFLQGRHRRTVKGKSDSYGEFNFYIPAGNLPDGAGMEYPILIRATSREHPGQIAWTVIPEPKSKYKQLAMIPLPGEFTTESNENNSGLCTGIHNVTLVLEPGALISGHVVDKSNGEPIANATVKLSASIRAKDWDARDWWVYNRVPGEGENGAFEVKTDEEGFYSFTPLPMFVWPEGSYKKTRRGISPNCIVYFSVSTRKNGYLDTNYTSRIFPGEELIDSEIDFQMHPEKVILSK